MSRLTPEREDQLRRLHASDPTGKLCATQRELLAEIDALRQEAARVRELEGLLTKMLNYGPASSDSWERDWREKVLDALAPTQRPTP